jgi:hypothetical protein
MPDDREFLRFAQDFQAEIIEQAGAGVSESVAPAESDFKENVFTRLVLDDLAAAGVIENPEVCHCETRFGTAIGRVNGYAVNDDEDTLDLFTSVYRRTPQPETLAREEAVRAIRQAVRYFREAIRGHHRSMEQASDAYAMTQRIYELRNRLTRVRLFLFTDGICALKGLDEGLCGEGNVVPVTLDVWDLQRLFRAVQSGQPRDVIEVDFLQTFGNPLPCLPTPQHSSEYQVFLTLIPGPILYRLYDEYGARLLELNVRSFLQAKGKVNRGIRDTLRQEPEFFLAYNNGISITADGVELNRLPSGENAIRILRGLQIVNGGQTTASIHRALKEDRSEIGNVYVQAKITVVRPDLLDAMVPKISRFANSQNPVSEADFSANDPYHIAIEQLSLTTWIPGEKGRWFYERARGQYQVAKNREAPTPAQRKKFDERTPPSRKFTKTDLAKFLNTWQQVPHCVSRGGQKNFLELTLSLRRLGKDWRPNQDYYRELIAKAILFKRMTRIVTEEGFPAYRANIVTYTLAYVSFRSAGIVSLRSIWESQGISPELDNLLRHWSHAINDEILRTAVGRNVTEWCKKEDCWQGIKALNLPLPAALPPEYNSQPINNQASTTTFTPQDLDNIARLKRVAAPTWLRIHAWGKETGKLRWGQAAIAYTLAGMAAGNWHEQPSKKQALNGVEILDITEQHGLLATPTDGLNSIA